MNYEEEKAMARRIQGGLHGANLKVGSKAATYVSEQSAQQLQGSPLAASGLKIETLPTPDTERMVQQLDLIVSLQRSLANLVEERLEQFCEPRPTSAASNQVTPDTRQCSSSYFRMLESRTEIILDQLGYLREVILSISAADQRPLGSGSKNS